MDLRHNVVVEHLCRTSFLQKSVCGRFRSARLIFCAPFAVRGERPGPPRLLQSSELASEIPWEKLLHIPLNDLWNTPPPSFSNVRVWNLANINPVINSVLQGVVSILPQPDAVHVTPSTWSAWKGRPAFCQRQRITESFEKDFQDHQLQPLTQHCHVYHH